MFLKNYSMIDPNLHHSWISRESVPRLVDDYMAKKLMVDEFVSHDVPYEKINEAFHLMHSGQSVRTVVHF